MQIPFKTIIVLDKNSSVPLYVQIANGIIKNIQAGILKTNTKLLGSRQMATLLGVNRQTIVAAYEELLSQNWIEVFPQKGTFIATTIPAVKPAKLLEKDIKLTKIASFFTNLSKNTVLKLPQIITHKLAFNDGLPDVRIAPREELARLYSHYIRFGDSAIFGYTDVQGNLRFRELLANYLSETRGLQTSASTILTTRGSQMGVYLASQILLQHTDTVIVGKLSYEAANITFRQMGATIVKISVDEDGLNVDEIEIICETQKVKLLYVTSHHYHPTTVTLKPERRIKLLALAEKYQFYILEDDYDYDYHYANNPVLPLASADKYGLVIYTGSFSKKIAPSFRVGYVSANELIIQEMTKHRRIIDRQNDTILENCLADMLENGTLKRYTTKALKIYRERRDFTCNLLKSELGEFIDFDIPNGGMAIWAKFNKNISLPLLAEKVAKHQLHLANGQIFREENPDINACRMGFASMNQQETEDAVMILKKVIYAML